jgi:1-phosphatidylinositol phosphodiesterase
MKTRFDKLSEMLARGVSRRGSNNPHSSRRPMKNYPCGFLTRWISVFVLLLVAHNGSVLAHNDGAYCHDASTGFQRLRWMSYLPDVWLMSNMSMVGTHDTMSFYGLDSIQTQSLPLSEQLNAGVRALDIRLARVTGGLALHHGVTYQTADFDDVLRTVVIFLSRNPSETVLMRVSSPSASDEKAVQAQALLQPSPINVKFADKYYDAAGMKNNMLSFSEMFMLYVNNPAFAGKFYQGPVQELSLGSVRGKILLLRDFSNQVPLRDGAVCPKGYTTKAKEKICDADFGLDYGNKVNFGTTEEPKGVPWFFVEDTFSMSNNWGLYDKWIKVKTMIDRIDRDVKDGQLPNGIAYYINYLSASGGVVFPYFVASGHSSPATGAPRLATGRTTPGWKSWEDFPRVNCLGVICTIAFEGTNTLAANHISSKIKKGLVGILMADFPGQGLIDAVIALNFEGDQSANATWKK